MTVREALANPTTYHCRMRRAPVSHCVIFEAGLPLATHLLDIHIVPPKRATSRYFQIYYAANRLTFFRLTHRPIPMSRLTRKLTRKRKLLPPVLYSALPFNGTNSIFFFFSSTVQELNTFIKKMSSYCEMNTISLDSLYVQLIFEKEWKWIMYRSYTSLLLE